MMLTYLYYLLLNMTNHIAKCSLKVMASLSVWMNSMGLMLLTVYWGSHFFIAHENQVTQSVFHKFYGL